MPKQEREINQPKKVTILPPAGREVMYESAIPNSLRGNEEFRRRLRDELDIDKIPIKHHPY